ncbi:hypothetical protein CLE01_26980 [Cryobacterium levicorallinum]|nr:hypothetical protein CLE01_26980 [Cryobacterium levicorallinum]
MARTRSIPFTNPVGRAPPCGFPPVDDSIGVLFLAIDRLPPCPSRRVYVVRRGTRCAARRLRQDIKYHIWAIVQPLVKTWSGGYN